MFGLACNNSRIKSLGFPTSSRPFWETVSSSGLRGKAVLKAVVDFAISPRSNHNGNGMENSACLLLFPPTDFDGQQRNSPSPAVDIIALLSFASVLPWSARKMR